MGGCHDEEIPPALADQLVRKRRRIAERKAADQKLLTIGHVAGDGFPHRQDRFFDSTHAFTISYAMSRC